MSKKLSSAARHARADALAAMLGNLGATVTLVDEAMVMASTPTVHLRLHLGSEQVEVARTAGFDRWGNAETLDADGLPYDEATLQALLAQADAWASAVSA